MFIKANCTKKYDVETAINGFLFKIVSRFLYRIFAVFMKWFAFPGLSVWIFFVPFSWCTKESMGLKIKLGLFYQNLSTDLTCPSASNRPELLRLRRRKRCRTKIELG